MYSFHRVVTVSYYVTLVLSHHCIKGIADDQDGCTIVRVVTLDRGGRKRGEMKMQEKGKSKRTVQGIVINGYRFTFSSFLGLSTSVHCMVLQE